MKKKTGYIALLLVLVMILSIGLVACNKKGNDGAGGNSNKPSEPEVVKPSELTSTEYLQNFVNASKSINPDSTITGDDAFKTTLHFDLILEKIKKGKDSQSKVTDVNVGVDFESVFDRKNPENSSVILKIKDQVVPHEIGVIATMQHPEFIYVNYLDQKFKIEINNGFIEGADTTKPEHPVTIVKKVLGTSIESLFKNNQQLKDVNVPLYGGKYSGLKDAEGNAIPLNFSHVIDAFLNVPFCENDNTVVAAKDWNVFTPINRLVEASELVPYAYLTFGQAAGGIRGRIDKALEGNSLASIIGQVTTYLSPLFNMLNPGMSADTINKLVNTGFTEADRAAVEADIAKGHIHLEKAVDMLIDPAKVLGNGEDVKGLVGLVDTAKGQLFSKDKTKLVENKDGTKEYTTALGSLVASLMGNLGSVMDQFAPDYKAVVTSVLESLKDMRMQYVTSNAGKDLVNMGIVFSTIKKDIITNTGFKVGGISIEKVDTGKYITNLEKELGQYKSDFNINANAELVVSGLTINNIAIDGTYNLVINGGFDFSKNCNNNLYVGLLNGTSPMLEATYKGQTVIIKIGQDQKMMEIMDYTAPLLVNALKASKNQKIADAATNDLEPKMLKNGAFDRTFQGFKVNDVSVARALYSSILFGKDKVNEDPKPDAAPTVKPLPPVNKPLNILNILDPVGILKTVLEIGVEQDPTSSKFVSIQMNSIEGFFDVKDPLKGYLDQNTYNQKAGYLLASTPNYVNAFSKMFSDLSKVNAVQSEMMYLLASKTPSAYTMYTILHDAYLAQQEQVASGVLLKDVKYTSIWNNYEEAMLNAGLASVKIEKQKKLEMVLQNIKFTDNLLTKDEITNMLAGNPLEKTVALLKGSAFFTDESNVIKNLMKANLHVDFVVNGTESKGTLSLKVGGTSVALNATLNITATKPANVKEIKVSENFMEKTIQYHKDAQFKQAA